MGVFALQEGVVVAGKDEAVPTKAFAMRPGDSSVVVLVARRWSSSICLQSRRGYGLLPKRQTTCSQPADDMQRLIRDPTDRANRLETRRPCVHRRRRRGSGRQNTQPKQSQVLVFLRTTPRASGPEQPVVQRRLSKQEAFLTTLTFHTTLARGMQRRFGPCHPMGLNTHVLIYSCFLLFMFIFNHRLTTSRISPSPQFPILHILSHRQNQWNRNRDQWESCRRVHSESTVSQVELHSRSLLLSTLKYSPANHISIRSHISSLENLDISSASSDVASSQPPK